MPWNYIVVYIVVFRHGDMLYLSLSPATVASMEAEDNGNNVPAAARSLAGAVAMDTSRPSSGRVTNVVEDEVDQFLWKQDGRIQRQRNEQLLVCGLAAEFSCEPRAAYCALSLSHVRAASTRILGFHFSHRNIT